MHTYRYLPFIVILSFLMSSCSAKDNPLPEDINNDDSVVLSLLDKSATLETKALYSQLWTIQSKGFMFGHHDDLLYGRKWMNEPGRSDVKEIVDDYPAVFSVDFAEIMDDRSTSNSMNVERRRTILEARKRGEVITAVCHLNNPLTGGDSWDNSSNQVVKLILEDGSAVNQKFKLWLDNLANFALNLKDDEGKLIPIIFRPFHEHTQIWSWWGKSAATDQEFINLWRFTINYLKDEKKVHNFIYAISPQMDTPGTKAGLMYRWPGDDYVDFIGMDAYHGTNTLAFTTNLRNLEMLSREKLKPCGVTETGIEGVVRNGVPYTDYWTKEILTPLIGRKISMVVLWRNQYDPLEGGTHFFGPWAGHSSAADFLSFYKSPITLFSKDLPDMYKMAPGVEVN